MKTSFTPGPWTYRGTMNGTTVYIVADQPEPALSISMNGGPGYIGELTTPNVGALEGSKPSYVSANACLIAAAPDLLAALEVLLDKAGKFEAGGMAFKHYFGEVVFNAHAAIAKAKGDA
jgi:hypothetical protein